ncbi:MAG: DUF2846 domain-containing protein [Terriglobales bacterium]
MRKIIAFIFLAICPVLSAQQALDSDAVVKLVKAGLSDDLIVSTINASPGNFDASVDGLIALKAAGVSDTVVAAIVLKANAPAPSTPATTPPPSAIAQAPAPDEPPPPLFHSTDGKIRLYVTDRPIFESTAIMRAAGDRYGGAAAGVDHTQAGDDPRTVEVEADIVESCPANIVVSNNPNRADYILVFRRRGGSRSSMYAFGGLSGLAIAAGMKVNGASLFENNGDMVYATKQTTVEKSIEDICAHIPAQSTVTAPAPANGSTTASAPAPAPPRSFLTAKDMQAKACGPKDKEVSYKASTDKSQHPTPAPPADKALIYVVSASSMGNTVQSRLAVDGDWKGTNRGNNYFYFTLAPGEHYFCSMAENQSELALDMAAGETYYLLQYVQTGIMKARNKLGVMSEEEGKSKLASAHLSTWEVK